MPLSFPHGSSLLWFLTVIAVEERPGESEIVHPHNGEKNEIMRCAHVLLDGVGEENRGLHATIYATNLKPRKTRVLRTGTAC